MRYKIIFANEVKIARTKVDELIQDLLQNYPDARLETINAIEALGGAAAKEAIPYIRNLQNDPNYKISELAKAALEKIER
ncbi:MAG: hypothetical protein WC838_07765 [Candidatus Margulisiibacteriota bacterium]|jgi:HEAT repeat protein